MFKSLVKNVLKIQPYLSFFQNGTSYKVPKAAVLPGNMITHHKIHPIDFSEMFKHVSTVFTLVTWAGQPTGNEEKAETAAPKKKKKRRLNTWDTRRAWRKHQMLRMLEGGSDGSVSKGHKIQVLVGICASPCRCSWSDQFDADLQAALYHEHMTPVASHSQPNKWRFNFVLHDLPSGNQG